MLLKIDAIMLKFRDTTDDTIARHNEFIQKSGYVWWGWWSREYEKVATEVFENVDNNTELYLFNVNDYTLRKAICSKVIYGGEGNIEIVTPDKENTPLYYSEKKLKMWFKLTYISDPIKDPNSFLKCFKYLEVESHFIKKTSFAKYYGKRFCDFEELESHRCTIWYFGRTTEEETIKEKFLGLTVDDVLDFKQKVLNSNSREDCRPPLPNLEQSDKYIFVSYSSKDYKSVYCDLIELYFRKIPFVYDDFLHTGEKWDNEIIRTIKNKNCIGMLSFLSENTFKSEPIMKEIKALLEKDNYSNFCVNLAGEKSPSKLLLEEITKAFNDISDAQKEKISSDQMINYSMKIINYLKLFDDSITFIPKINEPDNTRHISKLSKDILKKFAD